MNLPAERSTAAPSWLEVIRGTAPILLIAPHGGSAGAAARATLHPKVNDLETAEITRELAARLDAVALINRAMDRNQVDCNRVSQLIERAPVLLTLIADEAARLATAHPCVTILLIHGWNIIEPRIDLGLGLKDARGHLRAPSNACISASDAFIQDRVGPLATRLERAGIAPTFGLRYPGAGAQNLLQAFTTRHADSAVPSLRRLADLAGRGCLNALQLELSVAVRIAGPYRSRAIAAITQTFLSDAGEETPRRAISVIRAPRPPAPRPARIEAPAPAFRIGLEFFDADQKLGGMASFDFGANAAGGRIMMLLERRRVALFTGEGGAALDGDRLALGPLTFACAASAGAIDFRGPAVVVEDGTAYLSVENALRAGRLDPQMAIVARLEFDDQGEGLGALLAALSRHTDERPEVLPPPRFGRLRGSVRLDGRERPLAAVARVGLAFTGLGPQQFQERRMLWACVRDGATAAIETRSVSRADGSVHTDASFLRAGEWYRVRLQSLDLATGSPSLAPPQIAATFSGEACGSLELTGVPETMMALSRPGAKGARVLTSLGFAAYAIAGRPAVGMYEYSRTVTAPTPSRGPTAR